MKNILIEAIKQKLIDIGATGLAHDSCGCGIDDLMPCGNFNIEECKPANILFNVSCLDCKCQCSDNGCDQIVDKCWQQIDLNESGDDGKT